jgi:hypothetical protein
MTSRSPISWLLHPLHRQAKIMYFISWLLSKQEDKVSWPVDIAGSDKTYGADERSRPPASSRVQERSQRTDTGRGDPGITPARDHPDELDPRLLVRCELIPFARGRGGEGEDDLVHGVPPRHRNWPHGRAGTRASAKGISDDTFICRRSPSALRVTARLTVGLYCPTPRGSPSASRARSR